MESLDLNKLKESKLHSIDVAIRDIAQVARTLQDAKEDETDKIQASMVEISFFLNAIALSSHAFRAMVKETEKGLGPKSIAKYFYEEAKKWNKGLEEKC